MPKYDHNGEDFHYVVSYRLKGHDRAHEKFVYDWQQSEITIKNQEVFRLLISVSSFNSPVLSLTGMCFCTKKVFLLRINYVTVTIFQPAYRYNVIAQKSMNHFS